MARKPFESLLTKRAAGRLHRTSSDEEISETSVPEIQTVVEEEAEVPEDATPVDAQVFITPDGDLNIVLEEGLVLEGYDEPIHQIEVQVHTEELSAEEEAPAAEDLVTETPETEEAPVEVENNETEELAASTATTEEVVAEVEVIDTEAALQSLDQDNAVVAFIQAGNEVNPMWIVTKNGMPFATLAFADQEIKDEEFRKVFASDLLIKKVSHAASEIGWSKALPYVKAKLISDKGLVATAEPVDVNAIKAQAKAELFNDMQLAYALMNANVRQNPMADRLREAIVASGMEQPEVFVAGVMGDPEGSFVATLVDTAKEISRMSEQTKDEYKVLAARASVVVPTPVTYTPDHDFMARLAKSSVAVTAPETVSNRFTGLFTR